VLTFTKDKEVFLLRNPGAQTEQTAALKLSASGTLNLLRLSPAGDRLAKINAGYSGVGLHDSATGQTPVKLEHTDMRKFWDLGWLGGGQQLVGLVTAKAERGNAGSAEWVVLWDAATGKVMQTAPHRTAMNVLAIVVRIRDAATLAVQQEFRAHDGPITALALHPTKPIVATASADLSVKLWSVGTGRRLEEFQAMVSAPPNLPSGPAVSPRLRGRWRPPASGSHGRLTTSPPPPNPPAAGKTSSPRSAAPRACRPATAGAWKTARSPARTRDSRRCRCPAI
jgi:WD40 repeat protein